MSLQVIQKVAVDSFDGELLLESQLRRGFAPNRFRLEKFWQIEKFKGEVKTSVLLVSLNLGAASDGEEESEGEEE